MPLVTNENNIHVNILKPQISFIVMRLRYRHSLEIIIAEICLQFPNYPLLNTQKLHSNMQDCVLYRTNYITLYYALKLLREK